MADGDKATFVVQLIEKIRAPAMRVNRAIGKMSAQLEKFRERALSSAFGAVKTAALLGTLAAAGIAAATIGATVSFIDFNQRMREGFNSAAKFGASGAKLFEHSRMLAEELGTDVKETSKQFLRFLSIGFDPRMATDLMKLGSDFRGFGASAEEVQRIFTQLGQIQTAGVLQGDELRSLAENGLNVKFVLEAIAQQSGKTFDEVRKLKEAGKITSDMAFAGIFAAVRRQSGRELGELGKAMVDKSLGGMAGRLKAIAQNTFSDVAAAAEGPMMRALAPIAEGLGRAFKDPRIVEVLGSAFERLSQAIIAATPFVKAFFQEFGSKFMETAPKAFEAMGGALRFMSGSESDVMTNTKFLARNLGELAAIGLALAGVLGGALHAAFVSLAVIQQTVLGLYEGLIATVREVVLFFDQMFTELGAKIDAAPNVFEEKFFAIGAAIVEGLARGINALVNLPFVAIDKIAGGIKTRLKAVLGIASPSKVFMGYGENVVEGFALGLDPLGATLQKAIPANMNARIDAPEIGLGPMAASFADRPRPGDMVAGGGFVIQARFAPVFHISQQPGESSTELADDLEARLRRAQDDYFEELARAVGA